MPPEHQLPQPIVPIQPEGQNQAGQQTGAPGQPGRFQPHPRPVVAAPLQPVQPAPSVSDAPQSGTPYDFFLEPAVNAPKKAVTVKGLSGFTKMLIGAGIFLVLLAVLAIGLSLSKGSGTTAGTGLLGIAQAQQEIIRVSTAGLTNLDSQDLKEFAVTAQSTLMTSQKEVIDYGAKNGSPIDAKQLDLTKNANTDKALEAALSASTYDTTFAAAMTEYLTDYRSKIEQSITSATTNAGRDVLNKVLAGAVLLMQMLANKTAGDPATTAPIVQ